jgi:hypothetical protein
MKHARERSEARELPKSAKLRQDATGWARVKERRRRLRERPRGGKEHRLLLLSQKSGVFPDAGGDAGPARTAPAASRPATEGLDASKSKFFGRGTATICYLTSPGGRTYYFLEFCDRAPVFLVRWQARLPAGTVSRCGGTFSHRSGCHRASALNSVLPEHFVPTKLPALPKPPLGDFLRAGNCARAALPSFARLAPAGYANKRETEGLTATPSVKCDKSLTQGLRCRSLAGTARKLY